MTQKAFILASSRNPRQFIQRRGRVLRLAEGKEKAVIYDFIVLPPEKSARTSFDRGLVKAELERLEEFASSALNGPEASAKLLPIRIEYSLLET